MPAGVAPPGGPIPFIFGGAAADGEFPVIGAAMEDILPPFLSSAKIWRREAEVGQHQDDFLLVRPVALIADDQRRRHQQLLLQPLVRVHPVRSAETQREVVVGAAPRRYGRSGDARDAVLLPGRREAVPVDQAGLVDPVFHPDAKPRAHLGPDAEGTAGLLDAVHRRRLAVHLDAAAVQPQHRLRFIASVRPRRGLSLGTRARGRQCRSCGGRQQQGTA
jgi:hypothetical protein